MAFDIILRNPGGNFNIKLSQEEIPSKKTHTSFLTYLLINNTLLTINSGQIASSYGMETTSPNSIVWKFSKIQNSSNVYYPMYKDRKWRWISGNSEL